MRGVATMVLVGLVLSGRNEKVVSHHVLKKSPSSFCHTLFVYFPLRVNSPFLSAQIYYDTYVAGFALDVRHKRRRTLRVHPAVRMTDYLEQWDV